MSFFKELGKGNILGHSVHLMLVHFPSALFPFSLIMDGVGLYLQDEVFHQSSSFAIISALSIGLFAMLFGVIEVKPNDNAQKTANRHAGLNLLWVTLFSVILGLKLKGETNMFIILSLSALGNIGMVYSNFLGGELVLKYLHSGSKKTKHTG